MRCAWRALGAAACLLVPGGSAVAAPAAAPADTLHVPYLAQSWLLCGGAAIAMVERWWGRRGVFGEDFQDLVHPELGGIRTTDLIHATRARGWDVEPFVGTAARVRASLHDRRPVVALIQVSTERFHYVVIVSWHDDTVVFHDPAVGPYRSLDAHAFIGKWEAADRWALLVTPPSSPVEIPATPRAAAPDAPRPLPCPPWLNRAVEATRRNDLALAEEQLEHARAACPAEPLVLRERAGVAFRLGDHEMVIDLATTYLQQVPTDSLARRMLAASQYLIGDREGALASWNRIGRPTLDLLRVDGSHRIRFGVLADAIDLPLDRPLTSRALALARRRLVDVPGVSAARVGYVPVTGDRVEGEVRVTEYPRLPSLPHVLALGAARAVASDLAAIDVANLTGGGERLTVEWRWRRSNPGLTTRLEAPMHLGIPLVVGVSGRWERFRFDDGTETARRRSGGIDLHGWLTPGFEVLSGVQREGWGDQHYLVITLGGGLHDRRDHVALTAAVQQAFADGTRSDYQRVRTNLAWRSTTVPDAPVVAARFGISHATDATPRGLWPVAGGGISTPIPLRSRPLLIHDLLPSARTARTVVHGGIAADHPLGTLGPVAIGLGGFVDAAVLTRRTATPRTSRWLLDAGLGLQIGAPVLTTMQFRLDLARGLSRDGRWGLSAGLAHPWPPRADGFR
ncbi:MAG TPA: cysteine peptidase family C39 domain-containing protein [Gemmatimonadales bacterium]|nr:cysteine peptidase family C39 domain-containing protein [Gemmatimonadales bacterium]